MPELSRFFGIIIRMFAEASEPHHRPHFHASYQGAEAVFGLEPIELNAGNLPRTQQRLVEAWAEIHHQELLDDWNRLRTGEAAEKIAPLQ